MTYKMTVFDLRVSFEHIQSGHCACTHMHVYAYVYTHTSIYILTYLCTCVLYRYVYVCVHSIPFELCWLYYSTDDGTLALLLCSHTPLKSY